jgi:hypothetical protein
MRNAKAELKKNLEQSQKSLREVQPKTLKKILKEAIFYAESRNWDRLRNKLQKVNILQL